MATAFKAQHERVFLEDGVTLLLSVEEAEVLRVILALVGGSPSGARGKADAVFEALGDALGTPLYKPGTGSFTEELQVHRNSMYFRLPKAEEDEDD